MSHSNPAPRVAILLANLGTPSEPTASGVRRYLREFLSDTRVIEVPKLVWFFILRMFILPFRPKRVAEAYASIWQNGSPMRSTLNAQAEALQQQLRDRHPGVELSVIPVMSYGEPSLKQTMQRLHAEHWDHWIVLPLFPQYSATSTAPIYDQISRFVLRQRRMPSLSILRDYHVHPDYIAALAESIQAHWQRHGRADKLLLSFHGIPQPYADKGDPYPEQCRATAQAVAKHLGLADDEWLASFQSRFGLQQWVKPYTDATLQAWGKAKLSSVQVACPAFSADCLETLEEIAVENRHEFQQAGGGRYEYIPALNSMPSHIRMMTNLVSPYVTAVENLQQRA